MEFFVDNLRDHFQSFLPVSPTASVHPKSVIVVKGRSFNLNCKVDGYPRPTLMWTRDGVRLPSTSTKVNGSLEIVSADIEDSGSYRCVASNKVGRGEALVNVTILGMDTGLPSSVLIIGNGQPWSIEF